MIHNVWYGTKKEWERLEKPLLDVDPIIDDFVREIGLSVCKNNKGWPDRSIAWGDKIHCLIQLYLAEEKSLTFNLWLCAFQDRGAERYWKQEMPIKEKRIAELKSNLAPLLRDGYKKLVDWSTNKDQLEFAIMLKRGTELL